MCFDEMKKTIWKNTRESITIVITISNNSNNKKMWKDFFGTNDETE